MLLLCACAQSCLPIGDPMDCSPQDCFVHGISQVRILEWVGTSYSGGSSRPRYGPYIQVSPVLAGGFSSTASLGKLTKMLFLSILIFPIVKIPWPVLSVSKHLRFTYRYYVIYLPQQGAWHFIAKFLNPSFFSLSAQNFTLSHSLGSELVPDPGGHVNCFIFTLSPWSTMNQEARQNL